MIKILLVDDHILFMKGLHMLLNVVPDKYNVCGYATNGKMALDILSETEIDVILMDINMPVLNGYEAMFKIREKHPNVKIVALTMHAEDACIMKILEAGALGYLFKNVDEKEFFDCIETVHDNMHYITENRKHVLQDYLKKKKNIDMGYTKVNQHPLSNREIEIVKFIMQGKTNPEIADILFLSLRTVDTHRKNILSKLEINNAAALVKYASDNAPFLGLM